MAMHKANRLLITSVLVVIAILVFLGLRWFSQGSPATEKTAAPHATVENTASNDSAAESLNTLTAELNHTEQTIAKVDQENTELQQENRTLLQQQAKKGDENSASLENEVANLKQQVAELHNTSVTPSTPTTAQPITVVADLSQTPTLGASKTSLLFAPTDESKPTEEMKEKTTKESLSIIPYYTIPANATAVDDKLMSALVGRIPVKGVVTDPYPFKIVFADDTLAASGFRVPHLRQLVVSGYCEGDLNLMSVRGWVTSLSFTFEDGTTFNKTSNDNNIGAFTKNNSLGYLSDPWGDPFIRGKLITNAPSYLAGNIALGAAEGAASAYSQAQTTNQTTPFGGINSAVTGSAGKFVAGQAMQNAALQAQQWWQDREQESFDAIYVPSGTTVVVNFAKEIDIDYNPAGRKIDYENTPFRHTRSDLD